MRVMKTTYFCDHCGTEMEKPTFVLNLKTEDFSLQLKTEWHFCKSCWSKVSKCLNDGFLEYKPKENSYCSPFTVYAGSIVEN